MEEIRKILEAIDREVSGIMDDWSDPRSECREILRLTAQALALSSPHHEAREKDGEIGTPREFAERLAWMTINGKPDLGQWENHIKYRDAARSRLAEAIRQRDLEYKRFSEAERNEERAATELAAVRSQLARKDDGMRKAIEAYADEANWSEDAEGVHRVWHEPGSTTPEVYDGWSLARAAIREPDGRKGE